MTEIAINVENISKTFRIYHEKRDSIYETIIGVISKKKYYEEIDVLKDVSFSVKKGEMFGIIGRNGAGKTTLLRIIAGIYKPDRGNVTINGSLTPFLGLGTGFQIELTAKTNIIQYGILLGFTKKEITKKVDDIIKFAELEKFADIKLKNFSSGMYARLAFSTAVQVDPDILIIDEALYSGDLAFQQKCFDTIIAFKKSGKAILLVTHSMEPIKSQCDRAMWLDKGVVRSIGNPEKIIEDYTNFLFPKKN